MGLWKSFIVLLCIAALSAGIVSPLQAQTDTLKRNRGIDSFILKRKGLLGKLARNLLSDTARQDAAAAGAIVRNDLLFSIHEGRVIRSVTIQGLDFGTPINDTTKVFKNRLTRLANGLHRKTRGYVIRDNLFFKKGDKVFPPLLADNERHLRDQPYLQDARIVIHTSDHSNDSVDVTVLTKDVLSIGGSFHLNNTRSLDLSAKDDNLFGWGDRILGSVLYDQLRAERVGYGFEYIKRNIAGSFIDAYAGYENWNQGFNSGRDEETNTYARIVKPLVNPYMMFTYAAEVSYHKTANQYLPDSVYNNGFRYEYYNYDAWLGWNTGAFKLIPNLNPDSRLRTLLSMRVLKKRFQQIPDSFQTKYDAMYADLTGVLGSISIFGQNFYKTRYIYGFGRNEDVPEGTDVSLTAGWTRKQQRDRPYIGLDFSRNYFTEHETYFNFTFRVGGYWYRKKLEDVDVLANIDFFSKLHSMGPRWKQRTFISAGVTGQFNKVLNEELFLESPFGLPELHNGRKIGGDVRSTVKAESVFFSPLNIFNFKFAPFTFANFCLLTPTSEQFKKSDLYTSLGAGIRARNESLIFGTFELKAHYFPRANFSGSHWRIDFNTNVKFKYNRQIIKRPEILIVN